MSADSTNLASEFYILSVLHRLGVNAALTLANKKAVDIIVARDAGDTITVDVKGSAGTTGFFVNNVVSRPNHYVIFVTYLNRIKEPDVAPEVYIVPSADVDSLARNHPSGKRVVSLPSLRTHVPPYRDDWQSII